MKKLFVCATAIGLFLSVPALAAPNDDHHNDKHDAAKPGSQASAPTHAAHEHATHKGGTAHAATEASHSNTVSTHRDAPAHATKTVAHKRAADTHQTRSPVATTGRTHGNAGDRTHNATFRPPSMAHGPANTHSNVARTHHDNNEAHNTAKSTARTGHHPSINSLRVDVQATHRFHNGDYRRPAGYKSHHWSHGERLPRAYYARDYWLTDYVAFGLFAPPDGLVWVRVGNDALLVDRSSGDVVQVDYSVFY
jgi:Ni/Co efflux regulator RcnB